MRGAWGGYAAVSAISESSSDVFTLWYEPATTCSSMSHHVKSPPKEFAKKQHRKPSCFLTPQS